MLDILAGVILLSVACPLNPSECLTRPEGSFRWMRLGGLGAVCALVIAVYTGTAHSGLLESLSLNPADTYYNLLVQGFREGQLSLKKEVPTGFAHLADPYDPVANRPIGLRHTGCTT